MDLSRLKHVRNFGDAEKDRIFNLLKDIEAMAGVAFPPRMIQIIQAAHNTLLAYKTKKATLKQVQDCFATVGLNFYNWIQSTHESLAIEAKQGVVDDPLGSATAPDEPPNPEFPEPLSLEDLETPSMVQNDQDDVFSLKKGKQG